MKNYEEVQRAIIETDMPYTEIARKYDVHLGSVRNVAESLRDLGISIPRRWQGVRPITKDPVTSGPKPPRKRGGQNKPRHLKTLRIIDEITTTSKPFREIATNHSVSHQWVRIITKQLLEQGVTVPKRDKGRPRNATDT